MLTSGDVVDIDFGVPQGREAGFPRPAVVVTAQEVLDQSPSVVHVVPLTTTLRGFGSDVVIEPGGGVGFDARSAAQTQHLRAVAATRIGKVRGNVGSVDLRRVREVISLLLDL